MAGSHGSQRWQGSRGVVPPESCLLFGLLTGTYTLMYNFALDLNQPFDGVYQVRRSAAATSLLGARLLLDGELPELARGAVGRARQLLDAVGHLALLAAELLEHVVRQLRGLLPLLLEHLELRGLGALLDVLAAEQRRRRGGVVRQVAAVGEVAVEVARWVSENPKQSC